MKGFIYKLTSPSGKCYVGQTVNMKKRLSKYKTFHNCKNQKKLFNAIKKYGFNNFEHSILETIDFELKSELQDRLNELEIEYISKYDCVKNGYNICRGGNQYRLWVKETEEQVQKKKDRWTDDMKKIQSEKFKGESNPRFGSTEKTYSKEVNQYDKNGKYIKTWESAAIIERELGYNAKNIGSVCLGKNSTSYGFIWKFYIDSKDDIIPEKSKRGKQSTKGIHTISIMQYSKDNIFIKKFISITDAENELNINHTNISACAKGKRKTAGGFIWKYLME